MLCGKKIKQKQNKIMSTPIQICVCGYVYNDIADLILSQFCLCFAERKILMAQSIYTQPEYIGVGHCYYYLIGNLVILLCVIVYETL